MAKSSGKSGRVVIPEAKEYLDNMKYEIAKEQGVDLKEGYNGDLTAKQNGGIRSHKGEASGVWDGKRIRRLTPRECLRLQGWADERIDIVLPLQSYAQLYKQAGNGVTVNVVEAIGKRLAAAHREVTAID